MVSPFSHYHLFQQKTPSPDTLKEGTDTPSTSLCKRLLYNGTESHQYDQHVSLEVQISYICLNTFEILLTELIFFTEFTCTNEKNLHICTS